VRDQQYRLAVGLPDRKQPLAHLLTRQRIERAERLVKQQDLTSGEEGAKQRGPLSHPTGQGARPVALKALEAEASQLRPRAGARIRPRDARELEADGDVVEGRPPSHQQVVLRHVADVAEQGVRLAAVE